MEFSLRCLLELQLHQLIVIVFLTLKNITLPRSPSLSFSLSLFSILFPNIQKGRNCFRAKNKHKGREIELESKRESQERNCPLSLCLVLELLGTPVSVASSS
ncbi:unnamed protein product [Arctogadus glacialis]